MREGWQAILWLLLGLGGSTARPAGPASPPEAPPEAAAPPASFRREVLAVLTREGCSSGTCHGTLSGKNGFRLSLRGFDPALDFNTLAREAGGRRVSLAEPARSLILLKATAEVPHGGGRRFDVDSAPYRLLHAWLREGARDDSCSSPALASLGVAPASAVLERPGWRARLTVTARFADGSERDVTGLARFTVSEERLASVSPEGLVEGKERGEAAVAAEYLGRVATASLVFSAEVPGLVWDEPPESSYIDHHAFEKLRVLRIPPSPVSTAEEILRRAYLDVLGIPPSSEEARRFLADPSPRKRERLIDELLERPEFAEHWGMHWSDRLGVNQRFVGKTGAFKLHEWVVHAMASNQREDDFAREILTASGGNYSNAPAGFFRRFREPEMAVEAASQLFLGVRLECARCHNHPGDRWTQDDYYGMAAFFARVRFKDGPFFEHLYNKEETVYEAAEGELVHPRRVAAVAPRFLDGTQPEPSAREERRRQLAGWITSPRNPWFARQAANRIWFHLFGRGIVEPVDDVRGSNPPANEALLAALADDLTAHGFDRKHLIRTILRSTTYQLSSRPTPFNAQDEKYFSHARVRLLGAEQLLDAVSAAAAVPERFGSLPIGFRAAQVPDGEYAHRFLAAFGRPARAMACECERDGDTNLLQALELVGGATLDRLVRDAKGRVARLVESGAAPPGIVEELYLAALSRFPSSEERTELSARLEKAPDRRRAAEDLLWALVNHREFLFRR